MGVIGARPRLPRVPAADLPRFEGEPDWGGADVAGRLGCLVGFAPGKSGIFSLTIPNRLSPRASHRAQLFLSNKASSSFERTGPIEARSSQVSLFSNVCGPHIAFGKNSCLAVTRHLYRASRTKSIGGPFFVFLVRTVATGFPGRV